MEIANIQAIKILQIVILLLMALFAMASLFIRDSRKSFVFLFLFFLFSGIFSLILYYGLLFFIIAVPVIIFLALFYLFSIQNESFKNRDYYLNYFKDSSRKAVDVEKTRNKKVKKIDVPILVFPLFFCAGIAAAFIYNKDYIFRETTDKPAKIISLAAVAKEMFQNFSLIILLAASVIFVLMIWVISIAKLKGKSK